MAAGGSAVSVCLTTYNSASTIRASLESVLRQSYEPIEVLVADDGSTDETVDIALETGDSRVRVLRSATNRGGPAWGRNAAVAASRADFVAFLDADDAWREDKLELQIEALCATGVLATCSAAIAEGDGDSYRYPVGLRNADHRIGFCRLVFLNHVVASSAMVSRDLLTKVGGFPERIACIGFEDYCAWLQVATRTRWAFLSEALVHYSVGAPSLRASSPSSQADIRVECRRELRRQMKDSPSCRASWAFAGFTALSSSAGHLSALRHPAT